ncbi:putative ATP-binding cassette transporter [Neorhizobium huautlense]|uniref:ATP-binding cassette transporter n=2 Tax=Neorhizobium huautlense TaxID=67774 RepID=A0ABT9PZY2_9HYPH|nr:putative ATP-binding cassette transporter [Neorhizobium huautlense]
MKPLVPWFVDAAMKNDALKSKQKDCADPDAPKEVRQVEEQGDYDPPPPDIVETDTEMTPEELEHARKKYLLRRFWISARGFWSRRGDTTAWPFSVGLLALICINVGFQYGVNVWNRGLFDAIEQRNAPTVYYLGTLFPLLVIGSVGIVTSQVYVRMLIQRRWRSWLTKSTIARWLANGRYYQLNLIDGDHQNPEARLSEDMRIATEAPVDFVAGVIAAFLSASTFIVVLWTIGGALTISLGNTDITIPGFLVIAAVLYAIITSTSIAIIGRQFVQVSEVKNQLEAEFRYTLTRVRENGESIALLGGEEEERSDLDKKFGAVRHQWRKLANQYMRTTLVSHSSLLIAPIVPVLLCVPKFLDGSMSLGQVMQAASAFTIVQGAFGWLVDNYPRLADWNACARRVASLMMSLDGLERAEQSDTLGRITRGDTEGDTMLSLHDVSVKLGDGTAVVRETQVEVEPGERVLIAGESGSGKSTLVRAIAGLWPWGSGSVNFRAESRLFMLPQKPYIPTGTLRRAVSYPQSSDIWTSEEIGAALEKVGLGHLKDKIEDEAPWDQTLSGGEKQRLTFARLLLNDPDIIVMDEATAALDDKSQGRMMEIVSEELPMATILSVAHRAELEAFHSRKITLERRDGGARLVSDIDLLPVKGKSRSLLQRVVKRTAWPRMGAPKK